MGNVNKHCAVLVKISLYRSHLIKRTKISKRVVKKNKKTAKNLSKMTKSYKKVDKKLKKVGTLRCLLTQPLYIYIYSHKIKELVTSTSE